MDLYFRDDVHMVKMLYEAFPYNHLNIEKTCAHCVRTLLDLYQSTLQEDYLQLAVSHIRAYQELGFLYEDHEALFDTVLAAVPCDRSIFSGLNYNTKPCKLQKSSLSRIIGRWPYSPYNSHKREDLLNDIINKVKNREIGEFYYYTVSKQMPSSEVAVRLVVTEERCVLHHMRFHRFYLLEE